MLHARFACIANAQTVVKCHSPSLHAADAANELSRGLIVCKNAFQRESETSRNKVIGVSVNAHFAYESAYAQSDLSL